MLKRATLRYKLLLSLIPILLLCLLLIVQMKWQYRTGNHESKRSFFLTSEAQNETAVLNNKTEHVIAETEKSMGNSSADTAEKETMVNHECGDGKIYISNQLYDCDGIMKVADGAIPKMDTNEYQHHGVPTPRQDEEILMVPIRIKQEEPTHSESSVDKETDNTTSNIDQNDLVVGNKTITRRIFVNCGGTFPWAVELFLDTYPNSSEYDLFSFLPDKSYKVMYTNFPNHTTIIAEASYKTETQNVDAKSFGSGFEVTQTKVQIDLSVWLKYNTEKTDFVILRVESKEDISILKHLTNTTAIEHVDKCYTAPAVGDTDHIKELQTTLERFKIWDNALQTYSDFEELNPMHIPMPGKSITICKHTTDNQRFALFLYSPSASINTLKVVDLLQSFAPRDRLQLTIFLPYEMFKSNSIKWNTEKLFKTFHVGMYYNGNEELAVGNYDYYQLRNKATFVRGVFNRHNKVLQYILTGNDTTHKVIETIQEKNHYSFIHGGIDVTHINDKILNGETISIDDTGKQHGDFLLINIDKPNTEYLVLYMARRFAPWLLNLSECAT